MYSSRQIQKEIGGQVTEKMLEHELFRFVSMNKKQLKTRIMKMSNIRKLEACRQMAVWCGERRLAKLAKTWRDFYYNDN